jgi:hypothetical protein
MGLAHTTSLLSLIFVAFRNLDIIMSYGRSKCTIELNHLMISNFEKLER